MRKLISKTLRPGVLRIAALLVLAVLTVLYFYDAFQEQGPAALEQWRGRWPVLLLCAGCNAVGVFLDYVAWNIMYRRCGIRPSGISGILVYLSLYAGYLLPAQTGRVVRPDAVARMGMGSMRDSFEAEGALMYLDLTGTGTLILTSAAWLLSPWLAPFVAVASLTGGLAVGAIASGISRKHFFNVRPGLFWSWTGAVIGVMRSVDRAMLGLVLLLLVGPFAPDLRYAAATLYTLLADIVGAASGMPAGAIATEGTLVSLLHWNNLPPAHIAISVTLFRLVCLWSLVPIGWLALMGTFLIRRRHSRAVGEGT